jgi:hypothetical protein
LVLEEDREVFICDVAQDHQESPVFREPSDEPTLARVPRRGGKFSTTHIHHARATPGPVLPVSVPVVESPLLAPLVPGARSTRYLPLPPRTTDGLAVSVAAVTPDADVEEPFAPVTPFLAKELELLHPSGGARNRQRAPSAASSLPRRCGSTRPTRA